MSAMTTDMPVYDLNDSAYLNSQNETGNVSVNFIRPIDIVSYATTQSVFYIIYVTIFLLGIFGNCLVCYVVFRNKAMHTVTNYFITNLALADILLCVLAVPFTPLYFFMGEWIFGGVLCHILTWSQGVSVYVSTLTLTSIAIDRFFVIIYPFRPRLELQVCYLIVVCIWIFSLSATLPYAFYMSQVKFDDRFYCEEYWPSEFIRRVFSVFTAVMQFVIPFVIILYCYVRISMRMSKRVRCKPGCKSSRKDEQERERNKRTNRMLIAMVSIFGSSWLPMNVIHLAGDYYVNASRWPYYNLCFFISHVVAMSSTCYNPLLYAWLNENFRKEFKLVLPCFEQDPATVITRGQWKSDRTCNGKNDTQHELVNNQHHRCDSGESKMGRAGSLQISTLPTMEEEELGRPPSSPESHPMTIFAQSSMQEFQMEMRPLTQDSNA